VAEGPEVRPVNSQSKLLGVRKWFRVQGRGCAFRVKGVCSRVYGYEVRVPGVNIVDTVMGL
jgi:hypothetical protein